MEIDTEEVKKAGKYVAIGSAVALFLTFFMHAFILLAIEAFAVAGAYIYEHKKADRCGKPENQEKEFDNTNKEEDK